MGLRAVVFDLFGTLVDGWGEETADAKSDEIAELLGIPLGAFRGLMRTTYTLRASGELGATQEMLRRLALMLDEAPPEARLIEASRLRTEQFREVLREPRSEVPSLLAVLRDRGLRVGLISDCSAETPLVWPQLRWTAPIQISLFSWTEGLRKPAPVLYQRVCERLQVKPSECLYCGDGGSQELSGAERAGMKAVQLVRNREDGQALLQFDPDPNWTGERVGTLTGLLPQLAAAR